MRQVFYAKKMFSFNVEKMEKILLEYNILQLSHTSTKKIHVCKNVEIVQYMNANHWVM